jgi:phosphoglycerate dehydrogenase-like enzyme
MKLVCFPPLDEARLAALRNAAPSLAIVNGPSAEVAAREIVDAEAFFGKLTPPLLAAATRLRWVQSPTASLEHYVFPELVAHPCTLTNMRAIFGDVIADHVMAYVLCFARNLHTYLRQQQTATWKPVGDAENAGQNFLTGPGLVSPRDRAHVHLADAVMGIVGLGDIGAETARRASGFGMRVIAVDPKRTEKPEWVARLRTLDGLEELLAESDFVVVAAPHTPETEGMFRRPQFQRMKRSGVFINIGRGAIVRLADLAAALEAGEIAGAALDVFETEPLPPENPLWRMPNVLITPHVAACSPRIAERHLATLVENVRRFAEGGELKNVVDKAAWF